MNRLLRIFWSALLASLGLAVFTASAAAGESPPNWRGGGTGTTRPQGGVDVDVVAGHASHLGRFTGVGFHVLNPADLTFAGQAVWTAANGDTLNVMYTGQLFFTGNADFPFGFVGELTAAGGTGRFARAQGDAVLTGAFSGVPGQLYFAFEGSLSSHGR